MHSRSTPNSSRARTLSRPALGERKDQPRQSADERRKIERSDNRIFHPRPLPGMSVRADQPCQGDADEAGEEGHSERRADRDDQRLEVRHRRVDSDHAAQARNGRVDRRTYPSAPRRRTSARSAPGPERRGSTPRTSGSANPWRRLRRRIADRNGIRLTGTRR